MRLSVSRTVAAPRAAVFAAVSDFDRLEARLAGGSLGLERCDGPAPPQEGARWRAEFALHGVTRQGDLRIAEITEDEGYLLVGGVDGLRAMVEVSVSPQEPGAARLDVAVDMQAAGIAGRFLLQSARLMRARIQARLENAVARFAREIESAVV